MAEQRNFCTKLARYAVIPGLILLELGFSALGPGPDRRIHDPAVYRISDPSYLSSDWYTGMATQSGIYPFYARLIGLAEKIGISEEAWRLGLFILSLIVLYYALLRIGRLFSSSPWIIPLVAVFHTALTLIARPVWLYGPFLQADGGFAPRSFGVSLSFLALYYLLKKARVLPWVILGIATLLHPSNSFIVFTLFFAVWLIQSIALRSAESWKDLLKQSGTSILAYLVTGGAFALWIAKQGANVPSTFSAAKFIWIWVYFRAPYMALPIVSWKMWLMFAAHVVLLLAGWWFLHKTRAIVDKKILHLVGGVGVGAIAYFFLFYLVAFVWSWLPGFQFYSMRVIYLAYFVTYLFGALCLWRLWHRQRIYRVALALGTAGLLLALVFSGRGVNAATQFTTNLRTSWNYLRHPGLPAAQESTALYLIHANAPFLAPPDYLWNGSRSYLPAVASFKSFGFTKNGLEEWYERMNDVTQGELERRYQSQLQTGRFDGVFLNWGKLYSQLTSGQVQALSQKYGFKLFLTYRALSYPFPVVAEDERYRIYQLPAITH